MPDAVIYDASSFAVVEYRPGSSQAEIANYPTRYPGSAVLVCGKRLPGASHPQEVAAVVAAGVPRHWWRVDAAAGVVVEFSDAEKIPRRLQERIAEVQTRTESLHSAGFVHAGRVHSSADDSVLNYVGLDRAKNKASFTAELQTRGPIPVPGYDVATGALSFFSVASAADASAIYDSMETRRMYLVAEECRIVKALNDAAASGDLAALEAVQDTRT